MCGPIQKQNEKQAMNQQGQMQAEQVMNQQGQIHTEQTMNRFQQIQADAQLMGRSLHRLFSQVNSLISVVDDLSVEKILEKGVKTRHKKGVKNRVRKQEIGSKTEERQQEINGKTEESQQENNGKTKERIARLEDEAHLDLYSEERKDQFHAILRENCERDINEKASTAYSSAISAIKEYTDLDIIKSEKEEQGEKLTKARMTIADSYKELKGAWEKETEETKKAAIQKEMDVLNRYIVYFNTFTDGYLDVPEKLPKELCVDARKNMTLHTNMHTGVTPEWKDMKDVPLFAHEPSVNDIRQGQVGDCYLEAALVSLLTSRPEAVKECLKDNGDGTVTVRFFKEDGSAGLHPIYVTVTKDVPVVGDKPFYSQGAMWAQMIQKAYAAAGLHGSDADFQKRMENEAKRQLEGQQTYQMLTEKEKKEMLEEKTKELVEKYKYSYERIAGGYSSDFLRTLTGKDIAADIHWNVTAANILRVAPFVRQKLTMDKEGKSPEYCRDVDRLQALVNCLVENMSRKVTTVKQKDGTDITYASAPITIEDMLGELKSIHKWASGTYRYDYFWNAFKRDFPDKGEEEIEKELEKFLDRASGILEKTLETQLGYYAMQHRMFAASKNERGGETAKYSAYALERYEKIKTAIKSGKPVAMSTEQFIPGGVGAVGLNGESLGKGLVENHAYTVLGCREISGHRYIHLRNPWAFNVRGYTKITKPGADGKEPEVTYKARHIDKNEKQEGQFLMELNDFLSRANIIYGIS